MGSAKSKGLSISAVLKDVFSKIMPSGKNKKVETSLIEEYIYPKYGPGQLWEMVAKEIEEMGGTIVFNSKVTTINTKMVVKLITKERIIRKVAEYIIRKTEKCIIRKII